MIDKIDSLPALTRSWLDSLGIHDRDSYANLARSFIIERAKGGRDERLPEGVRPVLDQVDLRGKEIGAFQFAPAPGDTASAQIAEYDRKIRSDFDTGPDIVFVGDYGQNIVFLSPVGVGLLDISEPDARIKALSKSFEAFIIAQANAYDAYKAYIVKQSNVEQYRKIAAECAPLPVLRDTDTLLVFELQLKS